MKIHIPAFIPMAKCNEHLAHGPIDIDLGADVLQVVRCKDCKHYDKHGYKICRLHSELPDKYSSGVNIYMERDDFCSYGERKENT